MRRAIGIASVTLGAVLVLSGCVNNSDSTNTSAENTPTPVPSVADTAAPTDVDAAQAAAVAAMTDYLARERTPEDWWAKLSPHLSPEAAYYIEGTNPARIPASTMTGEASATASSATLVTVTVPSDAGTYTLVMTKRGDQGVSDSPWIVFSFTPPPDRS